MCCLALSAGFIGPRFALLMWWIFGDKVDAAFSSVFWPLLGLHGFWIPWDAVFAGAQLQRCSSAPSPSR